MNRAILIKLSPIFYMGEALSLHRNPSCEIRIETRIAVVKQRYKGRHRIHLTSINLSNQTLYTFDLPIYSYHNHVSTTSHYGPYNFIHFLPYPLFSHVSLPLLFTFNHTKLFQQLEVTQLHKSYQTE